MGTFLQRMPFERVSKSSPYFSNKLYLYENMYVFPQKGWKVCIEALLFQCLHRQRRHYRPIPLTWRPSSQKFRKIVTRLSPTPPMRLYGTLYDLSGMIVSVDTITKNRIPLSSSLSIPLTEPTRHGKRMPARIFRCALFPL